MSYKRRGSGIAYHPLHVKMHDALLSFVICQGVVYWLPDCPREVFKQLVLDTLPNIVKSELAETLLVGRMDMASKWYLLNLLAEKGRPVTLYRSEQEAFLALRLRTGV